MRFTRRDMAKMATIGAAATAAGGGSAQAQASGRNFVLVHGAWHGGWCWHEVATALRNAGHRVHTPTQTGLGERRHLLSREITLGTFAEDVANVLIYEDLEDVVLVGHSFAGMTISGVADRMPERLRQLIFLDSLVLESGHAPFDGIPPDVVAARIKAAEETSGGLSLPTPPASAFGIEDEALQKAVEAKLTPHPLSTYQAKLTLKNPVANGLPATYIICTDPIYGPLESSRQLAQNKGWNIREIATGHDAMVSAPKETAELLMDIAG
ncbi:alpha/beta fold hydrolase [Paracoccus sp. (in: a-proteobacteria)]|uniref:alpha/beta fold hydrolase n=1 Tax=Paracoccus sp. TaxID=267 RepID=UPI003A84C480